VCVIQAGLWGSGAVGYVGESVCAVDHRSRFWLMAVGPAIMSWAQERVCTSLSSAVCVATAEHLLRLLSTCSDFAQHRGYVCWCLHSLVQQSYSSSLLLAADCRVVVAAT
jgi:hypothetical protein